jgi:hypothetical protein
MHPLRVATQWSHNERPKENDVFRFHRWRNPELGDNQIWLLPVTLLPGEIAPYPASRDAKRYPTPDSVSRYLGFAGSSSSLWRSWDM